MREDRRHFDSIMTKTSCSHPSYVTTWRLLFSLTCFLSHCLQQPHGIESLLNLPLKCCSKFGLPVLLLTATEEMFLKHLSRNVLMCLRESRHVGAGGNQLGSYLRERLTHKEGGTMQHLPAANDTAEQERNTVALALICSCEPASVAH